MSSIKRQQRSLASSSDASKRSKREWIEGAVALKRERFELAGALFDCCDDDELTLQEVQDKLTAYLGLSEQVKEERVNVDTAE
ncbi:hypothetical protein C2I18_14370 [Paenibacillus sp. PK3_47]|uniref:hypothetical protein n=1 Tax=Paenibacillus sp. PK3_47 TaxID=2072642 RepID=UPI00201E279B|nr:hypothetical protein [Paenibacillus sp. PK3_47]UQZ34604.1 hypothetical protein C2I18_14370 [Paenibacillus sp. PK3_47]